MRSKVGTSVFTTFSLGVLGDGLIDELVLEYIY
jgi:hypothetical protein